MQVLPRGVPPGHKFSIRLPAGCQPTPLAGPCFCRGTASCARRKCLARSKPSTSFYLFVCPSDSDSRLRFLVTFPRFRGDDETTSEESLPVRRGATCRHRDGPANPRAKRRASRPSHPSSVAAQCDPDPRRPACQSLPSKSKGHSSNTSCLDRLGGRKSYELAFPMGRNSRTPRDQRP